MGCNAERISRCRKITLEGNLTAVFPLFGPIDEAKWATGWAPEVLYPPNGTLEEHMVFQTIPHHATESLLTWTVSKYDPKEALIEYTVFAVSRVWVISIKCTESGDSRTTEAQVCYTYTGLTQEGNDQNKAAMERTFAHDLKDWEEQINYYLNSDRQRTHLHRE